MLSHLREAKKLLSNNDAGRRAEARAKRYMEKLGYTLVGGLMKGDGYHGLDGLFKKGDHYVAVEVKAGRSSYELTKDGRQMSAKWVKARIAKDETLADEVGSAQVARWEIRMDAGGDIRHREIPW